MSLPPVAWRYARHATQTQNVLPQHISPNPADLPLPPHPAFFIIQLNILLLTYALLIEDRQLYANRHSQCFKSFDNLHMNTVFIGMPVKPIFCST